MDEYMPIIYLDRNQILSLEPLASMQMNNLKVLSFSYNNIVSVRPIRRMFLPNITQIQLGTYRWI